MSHALAQVFRRSATLGVVAAFACGAPPRPPVTQPTVVVAPAPEPDPLAGPWVPSVRAGSVAHEIQLSSELRSRIDSVERVDSLHATIGVEWSRLAGAPARVSGLLNTFRVSGDTTAARTPSDLRLPVPFSGLEGREGDQLAIERPDVAGCGPDAAALQAVREVVLTMPRRLEVGTSWADSARYTVCRDSIPLAVRSVRTYRVVGAERLAGVLVVLIDRASLVTMRGTGTQFGELLTIEAQGEGAMRLAVRLDGAMVVLGRGESTLKMTMRGRRRSQELSQHTHIEIAAP